MTTDAATLKRLAFGLPDIPRWIEARAMLLNATCEVFGASEGTPPSLVAYSPYTRTAVVVGQPPQEAIHEAATRLAQQDGDLLAYDDNLDLVTSSLDGWTSEPVTLHLLSDSTQLPVLQPLGPSGTSARPFRAPHPIPTPYDRSGDDIVIRLVSGGELTSIDGVSQELAEEVQRAALVGKLAAVFVNGKAVSFCDAATETEGLWDIGIETLEDHRRQGYAALAVSFMVSYMGRYAKNPVWGAEDSNEASMRAASRLGFRAVDRLFVLHPSGWLG